jgi:drug/metabolite transporter (DMT)-like permease
MLASTFFFALMNVCIKQVGHIPAMEIVFFRCLVSLLICLFILNRENMAWQGSNRKLLLARGIFGTIALYTFFITLRDMPLGTAVTIQYMSPIFTTIIAIFLLGEKVKHLQWLFFILSFAGVMVIKGFDSRISVSMLAIGITSAIASAFAYNMVRSLKEKEHPIVVVLHFQIIGTIAGLAVTLFNWKVPVGMDWLYLFLIGVFTQLGQENLTKALQLERIANVSILNYLGVIYALGFGYMFFNEQYGVVALSGILLVLIGVVLNYFYLRTQTNAPADELMSVEE